MASVQKIALITGASSGIGRATADLFLQNKIRVIACGRRTERLEELKQSARDNQVFILPFDVRIKDEVNQAIESLPAEWQSIDYLVNNAGNAHGLAPIQSGDLDDWENMIDINVKGLLYVSKAVIPGMVTRKSGHIVNIGSIAGKEAYPNGNVYCASKHAVDALNKAMRMDLFREGIRVSAVNPGLVETEFSLVRFKGDQDRADKVYQGYQALTAKDIAEIIYFVITRPAHVNVADLIVLPTDQASSTMVNRKI
jgi:NADP-dependent 3-hydroxy acid dehydrogenase YdfG